jgi:hypothetical protein
MSLKIMLACLIIKRVLEAWLWRIIIKSERYLVQEHFREVL